MDSPIPPTEPASQERNYSNPRKRKKKKPQPSSSGGGGEPSSSLPPNSTLEEEEAETGAASASGDSAAPAASAALCLPPFTADAAAESPAAATSTSTSTSSTALKLELARQLAARPSAEDLAGRHVLTGSINTGARIRAAQESIVRLLQRDTLARSLRNRAKPQELRDSGILRATSLVKEHGLRELLSQFLHTRPNAEDLHRREVLKDTLCLWTQLEVPCAPEASQPPSPRHFHTLTVVGRRVVLLGGLEAGGETMVPLTPILLEIDRGHWHAPQPTSAALPLWPFMRYAHTALAYGRFVLVFGGYGGKAWLNDVWLLEVGGAAAAPGTGGAAAAAEGAGHSPVSMPPAFYSPSSGEPLPPLPPWERDAQSSSSSSGEDSLPLRWHLPPVRGQPPSPRAAHTTVRAAAGALMLLFGGSNGARLFSDLHALALTQRPLRWCALEPEGTPPSPRSSHSAVALQGGTQMLVFGGGEGWGNECFNDLFLLDATALCAALADGLSLEAAAAGQWARATSAPLLWLRPAFSGSPPSPRAGHAACLVGERERMLVFGGWDARRRHLSDLHILDTQSFCWSKPSESGSIPSPRAGHAMVATGDTLVVLGGCGAGKPMGDLFSGEVEFSEQHQHQQHQHQHQQLAQSRQAVAVLGGSSTRREDALSSAAAAAAAAAAPPPPPHAATPSSSSPYVPAWRSNWASRAVGTGSLSAALDALRPVKQRRGELSQLLQLEGEELNLSFRAAASTAALAPVPASSSSSSSSSTATAAGLVQQALRAGSPVMNSSQEGAVGASPPSLPPNLLASGSSSSSAGLAASPLPAPVPIAAAAAAAAAASSPFAQARSPAKSAPPQLRLQPLVLGGEERAAEAPERRSSGGGGSSSSSSSRGGGFTALDADAVSVSSTKELVAMLAAEVAEREKEDEDKYSDLLAQLQSWRAERRLETSLLFDALEKLHAAVRNEP